MSVPAPTAMSWGNPGAAKRALLIHGLTASSQYWTIIADTLSKLHGYYVVAPDLLGHGYASRPSTTDGAEYTVEKLAANVQPLLSQHGTDAPVSLVICHSLGCLVTLSLLSSGSLASHTHIVLLDPPLELSPGKLSHIHGTLAESVMHVATIEQTAGANPRWQPRDVVSQVAGKLLCDEHVVTAIINQNPNSPWSYTDRLPTDSERASVTIIAGDPARGAVISAQQVEDLKRSHPHIRTYSLEGASHNVPRDFPEVVVKEALDLNDN